MFKFNKKMEYALVVLKHFSVEFKKQNFSLATVKEIAQKYNCSEAMLAKVMQNLKKANILIASKGVLGGYAMVENISSELTIKDLFDVVIGPVSFVSCMENNENKITKHSSLCEQYDFCNIVQPMHNINLQMIKFFSMMRVDDILKIK